MFDYEPIKQALIDDFNQGKSCQQICSERDLQCHPSTLLKKLKAWGVDTAHKHNPEWWGVESSRNERVKNLRQQGKSFAELALIFGCSKSIIQRIVNK